MVLQCLQIKSNFAYIFHQLMIERNLLFAIPLLVSAQLIGIFLENSKMIELFTSSVELLGSWVRFFVNWINKKTYREIPILFARPSLEIKKIILPQGFQEVLKNEGVKEFLKQVEHSHQFTFISFRGKNEKIYHLFSFSQFATYFKYGGFREYYGKYHPLYQNQSFLDFLNNDIITIIQELFLGTNHFIYIKSLKFNPIEPTTVLQEAYNLRAEDVKDFTPSDIQIISFNPQIFQAVMKHLRKHKLIDF